MKKVLCLGSVLFFAGTAQASAPLMWGKGIVCRWADAKKEMVCVRSDSRGYAIAFNKRVIIVANARGRIVYTKNQP